LADEPGRLELLKQFTLDGGIAAMCLSPSYPGTAVLVATNAGCVQIINATTMLVNETLCEFREKISVMTAFSYRRPGDRVAWGGDDGRLVVLDLLADADKALVAEMRGHSARINAVIVPGKPEAAEESLLVSAADDGAKVRVSFARRLL
jgi:hypothetical protein